MMTCSLKFYILIILLFGVSAPSAARDYYFPTAQGSQWTYKVKTNYLLSERTVTISDATHNRDGSWLIDFTGVQDNRTYTDVYALLNEDVRLTRRTTPEYDYGFWGACRPTIVTREELNSAWNVEIELHIYESPGQGKRQKTTLREIGRVVARENVETPAGTFRALRVERVSSYGNRLVRTIEWYAPGIGLVRQIEDDGENLIELTLKSSNL